MKNSETARFTLVVGFVSQSALKKEVKILANFNTASSFIFEVPFRIFFMPLIKKNFLKK